MSDFFKPTRRKLGVVTLVLACVIISVWVRSLILLDHIELPVGKHATIILVTYGRSFAVLIEHDPDVDVSSSAKWLSKPSSEFSSEELYGMDFGSVYSVIQYRHHPPVTLAPGPGQPYRVPKLAQNYFLLGLPIPYSTVGISLVLLSLWLLIREPRPVIPKTTEGASHEKVV